MPHGQFLVDREIRRLTGLSTIFKPQLSKAQHLRNESEIRRLCSTVKSAAIKVHAGCASHRCVSNRTEGRHAVEIAFEASWMLDHALPPSNES